VVFHVGFHKTGTSYLQGYIFPLANNYKVFSWVECDALFKPLLQKNDAFYKAEQTQAQFKKMYDGPLPVMFSYEEFVGPLFYQSSPNLTTPIQRIKELGVTQIVFTIRNQYALLDSIYRQYIQKGGVVRSKDFLDESLRIFAMDYCNFYPIIQHFVKVFGKENVLVLPSEELKKKEAAVLERLQAFCGISFDLEDRQKKLDKRTTNVSLSNLSLALLRRFNHISYNYYRPSSLISKKLKSRRLRNVLQSWLDPSFLSKFSNKENYFKKEKERIDRYYAENNRKLNEEFGLHLETYKYPM
jgi:hypothetical protein